MFFISLLNIVLACNPNPNAGWSSNYKKQQFTSVQSITGSNTSTVCPVINPSKVPFSSISALLSPNGCLGFYGPLGVSGPLSQLGPLGGNVWNPQMWSSLTPKWMFGTNIRGPLDKDGPLGYKGPVSNDQYYGQSDPAKTLFLNNDFDVQTRAFGLWSALGPIGPLGALGPLGPLGPIGNQFSTNANGQYLNGSAVITNITIDYDGVNTRNYPLYEQFTAQFAAANVLDTSFFVENYNDQVYRIAAQPYDQIVIIVVTPLNVFSDLDLFVYNQRGQIIAQSETANYVETIQLSVPSGTAFSIEVQLASLSGDYRLFVTGSTQYINEWNIEGNQIF